MNAHRLLMVDDEPDVGSFVCRVARRVGYEACATEDADAFKMLYRSFHPNVVVLDLAIPETDGIELLAFLAEQGSRAQVLLMSGFDAKIREAARHLGEARGLTMAGIVPKPVRAAALREVLQSLKKTEE